MTVVVWSCEAKVTTRILMKGPSRWFQIVGIPKRSVHCLTGIYWTLSELNIKNFIKLSRLIANKLANTKKTTCAAFYKPPRAIKDQPTRSVATVSNMSVIDKNNILKIPGNQLRSMYCRWFDWSLHEYCKCKPAAHSLISFPGRILFWDMKECIFLMTLSYRVE